MKMDRLYICIIGMKDDETEAARCYDNPEAGEKGWEHLLAGNCDSCARRNEEVN